jgi:hypothetical protein
MTNEIAMAFPAYKKKINPCAKVKAGFIKSQNKNVRARIKNIENLDIIFFIIFSFIKRFIKANDIWFNHTLLRE